MTATPEIDQHSRVRPASGVYARPFGEELVLLEFGRGEYFALDEIGARIWRSLEAGRELVATASEIASVYDVGAEQALADILALVRDMQSRALVDVI